MKKIIALSLFVLLLLLAGCGTQAGRTEYIGIDGAKAVALKDAGVTEGEFSTAGLDERNGISFYQVDFTAGGKSYEYSIDAVTGAVIEANVTGGDSASSSSAAGNSAASSGSGSSSSSSGTSSQAPSTSSGSTPGTAAQGQITQEEAINIAKNHAQVTDCFTLPVKQDWENGRLVYDVEFYTSDGKEYDYEIDATTGEVLSYDYDMEQQIPMGSAGTGTAITEDQARQLVLDQVPGATRDNFIEFKVDYDDGRLEYEGELLYNGTLYEFTVDGYSGTIRDWESERAGW